MYKIFRIEMSTFTGQHLPYRNNKVIAMSHVLRVYLTYKYGGMYIDNDTFPIKPFDDWLLSESFQSYHDNFWHAGNVGEIIPNCCLLYHRRQIGKYVKTIYEKYDNFNVHYICDDFYELRDKFMNCKLQIGQKVLKDYDGQDYYVDHFIHTTIHDKGNEHLLRNIK